VRLSHRDFRPPRRSKYVLRPPKRRPTLRILLLLAIGLAVYLEFDKLARAPVWRRIGNPRHWLEAVRNEVAARPAVEIPSPVRLAWEPDSSALVADCPAATACLDARFPLGAAAAGEIRELLGKVKAQWDEQPEAGFTAAFSRIRSFVGAEPGLELVRLEFRGSPALVLDRRRAESGSVFCAARKCLDQREPMSPLEAYSALLRKTSAPDPLAAGLPSPPAPCLGFACPAGANVRAVLRGRVISIPVPGDSSSWLKLHHGGNLFSYYRGLSVVDSAVRVGAMVPAGGLLGRMADGGGDAALDLRIESQMKPIDPLAFLGLPDAKAEAPDGL
jgi:hypothetical protein